ncbi:hypothetical protein B0I35DRAFT_442864 [Stachybotrys elegans]|uniref:glutamate--tRNA ligase n=1 Tax=Stachybotrys elegans TaxID=80388 RepID=A0A8K0SF16_9HYPO|nr:hypothetical protein B0I35DRAFT_442864 [Stachybotrys elegans]
MSLARSHARLLRCTLLSLRRPSPVLLPRRGHATASSTQRPLAGEATVAKAQADEAASPKVSGLKALRKKTKRPLQFVMGQSSAMPIRARFAPSPTGSLHLGSLRTALYNKLAAMATNDGAFILRIEDTDQTRLVPGAEEGLMKDLEWAGLTWDEGPDRGGPYGPYRQSERLDIYHKHALDLLEQGSAYRCFCSQEKLDADRELLRAAGKDIVYQGHCRHIPPEVAEARAAEGEPNIIRLHASKRYPKPHFDPVYGGEQPDHIGDFILIKSDGFPTYHFANVVDDHLMKITHVIRGEEWLISTPKHLMLYEAFAWKAPVFVHLGLLTEPYSGGKLSKRNASGNLSTYRGKIFPIPLLTWLAALGGSFRQQKKVIRTLEDMAEAFSFKFTKGNIALNYEKLHHFQKLYCNTLAKSPIPELGEVAGTSTPETQASLVERERQLVHQTIIHPIVDAIGQLTAHHNHELKWPFEGWNEPLTLIPSFADDEQKLAHHIKAIVMNEDRGFELSDDMLYRHPYFFWRVPRSVYLDNMPRIRRRVTPDSPLLNQGMFEFISHVLQKAPVWEGNAEALMAEIVAGFEARGIKYTAAHYCMRLAVTGWHETSTQPTRRLLQLIPREEWIHRLGLVQEAIRESENTVSEETIPTDEVVY